MTVPDGWKTEDLEAIADVDREALTEKTPKDFAFYYLDIGSVSEGKIALPDVETLFSDAPSRARRVVRRHDVLMATVRPNLKAFAYFDHLGGPFIASTGFAVLSAKDPNDPRFILYAILSDDTSRQIDSLVSGSNYPAITSTAVRHLKILTPPDKEQAKLADVLATVDADIRHTEAAFSKQCRVRTGLMQVLLTRGIGRNGAIRTEATHAFKDSKIGRIPVDWDVVPLKSAAEFVTSGSRGWAQYYSIDGALFLRIGNLTRDHINLRFDDVVRVTPPKSSEGRRTSVSAGDLLISITADLGIIGVIPDGFVEAYVNQHIALVRIDKEKANPRFVGWFLSGRGGQTQFGRLNESGAKAGLSLPTIERLLVPTTKDPLEQERIAEILDTATRQTDQTLRDLEKLRRLKAGLMQDLLSGRKRVTPLLAAAETVVEAV
jgi:type I restriction enzyme S subunit